MTRRARSQATSRGRPRLLHKLDRLAGRTWISSSGRRHRGSAAMRDGPSCGNRWALPMLAIPLQLETATTDFSWNPSRPDVRGGPTFDVSHRHEARLMRRDATSLSTAEVITPVALLLRITAVIQATGLGRSTIYKLIAEDKFPLPVQLTGRAVAWRRADLERWSATRPTATHWPRPARPWLFSMRRTASSGRLVTTSSTTVMPSEPT